MPILPGNQANSPTVQQIARQLKADPAFYNILGGAAGWATEPILTIANEVLSRILAENMPWIWNRAIVPPFLTASLQQDYCSQLTNIGWLEDGWRIDINNSTSNNNGAPKPIFSLETIRYSPQASAQSVPFNISYVPNTQAFLGLWQANTLYSCGYGAPMTPRTPIQQFMDVNGNILYIDSTQLGLTINAPGYTGTPLFPPGAVYPYGTSGNTQPAAPPNATPGTLVQDGSVIWTVAPPDGYAIRLFPLPALNGLCWWINCQYQISPPVLNRLQDQITVPNYMSYLFRQGCRAMLYQFQGNAEGQTMYQEWLDQLFKALRAGDRQTDDFRLYPDKSVMGGYNPWMDPAGIGAAWPYGPGPYAY